MTRKIKDDNIVVDGKDKFEHLSQATTATATATTSPGHLNFSAFYCWLVKLF